MTLGFNGRQRDLTGRLVHFAPTVDGDIPQSKPGFLHSKPVQFCVRRSTAWCTSLTQLDSGHTPLAVTSDLRHRNEGSTHEDRHLEPGRAVDR